MNYLAHAYLSFNDENLLVGNMISDHVKGKTQYDFPAKIQAGIKLHRAIDLFTDEHIATKNIKQIFAPAYRLYAGAFVDIAYDYFLANDKSIFSNDAALLKFSLDTYSSLQKNKQHFPLKFGNMFPYMMEQNWLYHYQFEDGIKKSYDGLKRRATYITETETAINLFIENKTQIQKEYDVFFKELKLFSRYKASQLLKDL